jgi:hypothetical protein
MTTDVRTLLHDAADAPLRQADIVGARQTARARRRRRRGLAGALAAVVVAVATVGVVRGVDDGGSPARVAIGPRQSNKVPDGWTPVELDSGIRLALPPGWGVYDFGVTPTATKRVSAGTSPPADTSVMTACGSSSGQVPTSEGTWLSLWEYPDATVSEVPTPGGGDILGVNDRPADFRDPSPVSGVCQHVGNAPEGEFGGAFELFAFRDAGRVFVARVVTAYPTGATADFSEANDVLNTLRITPLPPTTTAEPVVPTVPTAPTTTAAPFVPTSDDEQEISQLVARWLRDQNDDEIRATFEDADSILDAIHQGMAQHSQEDLAKYSGHVDSIQITDPEHAVIEYTLLWNGQAQFGTRTGAVLKIDGAWRVSRDTECALLSLGNVPCPPRSG